MQITRQYTFALNPCFNAPLTVSGASALPTNGEALTIGRSPAPSFCERTAGAFLPLDEASRLVPVFVMFPGKFTCDCVGAVAARAGRPGRAKA